MAPIVVVTPLMVYYLNFYPPYLWVKGQESRDEGTIKGMGVWGTKKQDSIHCIVQKQYP